MELNTEPEEPDSAENENPSESPEHDIHTGDIVQHFKREWVSPDTSEYLYKVLAVAITQKTVKTDDLPGSLRTFQNLRQTL